MNADDINVEDGGLPFDLERIIAETFVGEVDYHETVDSTNDVALAHCRRRAVDGPLLVLAAQQTRGRGRGANSWWSVAGSLTFSLIISPTGLGVSQERWPQASLTTGLSVCLALDHVVPGIRSALKWPNDVFLNGGKVCGILVEVAEGSTQSLVLGIGINVNNSFVDAPPELTTIATSLADATGREFDRTEVLIALLKQFETQFRRLAANDPQLPADWLQRCALRGLTVTIETPTHRTTGRCAGIDPQGALVLETVEGPERFFGGVITSFE
ncbi:Bifunctional ligase/repressor BirA [Symmachiella macrocystis]|uniref:biotin--[biotin carboxyl-carrier protein] ligase n=1 Tax=Symmachiella macrocystis TaxID=2527985 RepID=A0A5C6BA65_9PLAN|nr:biotin--[acetyl-CoA-carboxylase] ligase [Symmachiella macrocystis]TWU08858.1 Bifunctional ligase/repressor BirA [Symmachiella macrocystis]